MIRLALKISLAFDRAIVFASCVLEFDADPFTCLKQDLANEPNNGGAAIVQFDDLAGPILASHIVNSLRQR
jgi:hypothetical protein